MKFLYHRLYIYINYLIIETCRRIYKDLYMIAVVVFIFINIQMFMNIICSTATRNKNRDSVKYNQITFKVRNLKAYLTEQI